jgi:hypothetical protein
VGVAAAAVVQQEQLPSSGWRMVLTECCRWF